MIRLDNFVSKALNISRNEANRLIYNSLIRVDDQIVKTPSFKFANAKVFCDNKELFFDDKKRYFLLYKPADFVSSTISENGLPSALDLLDTKNKKNLHFAGRLDSDTTGVLLISDDGVWTHKVTSPKNSFRKTYLVNLADQISLESIESLKNGVLLKNEKLPTKPAVVEVVNDRLIRLVITEGKYHQVKRMCAAIGNKVVSLHREKIETISLDNLKIGEFRELTLDEIDIFN